MKAGSSKRRLILLSGLLLSFLVVLNMSTFVLYTRAKDYLDAELGERLRSIALMLAHTTEIASDEMPGADETKSALK